MTDQPEQLASIIADINQVLARLNGRKPLFASPDWERQKQILERTRAYLLQIQTPDQRLNQSLDQPSDLELSIPLAGGSSLPSRSTSPSPEAAWQQLPSQILQSLQGDLERLRQQREALLEEIRALESLRSQQRSLAQQHQAQQQIISEFLQGLTGRLQDNINQQIAQTLARLENQLLAQEQIRDATTYPPTAQTLPLRPTQRVEQLQMLQMRSDQLLMTLDATLRSVFETLQRNIQSYEESLSLGVSNMHNLGQQGEVLFTALVKQLTEQLAQDISQQLVAPNPSLPLPDVLPIAPPPPVRPTTSLPYPEQVSYIPHEEDATIIQNFPYAGAEVIPRLVRQSPSPLERSIEQDLSELEPEFETAFNLDLELDNLPDSSDGDDDLATLLQPDPVTSSPPSAENVELDLFYESLFGSGEESVNSTATSTPEQTADPALDSLEQALFSGLADPAETPVSRDEAHRSPSRPPETLAQELFAEAWDEDVQRGGDLVRNLPLPRPSEGKSPLDPSVVTIGLLTDLQFESRLSPLSVEPTPELSEADLNLEAHLLDPLPPDENEEAEAFLVEEDSYIPAPPEENLLPLELLDGEIVEETIRDQAALLPENRRDLSLDPEILQRLSEDLGRFEQSSQSQNEFNEFSVEPDLSVSNAGVDNRLESQAESLEFAVEELASEEFAVEELASELPPHELSSLADLDGVDEDTPDSPQALLEALTAEINQSSQTLVNAVEVDDLAIAPESSPESVPELEMADSELEVSDLTIAPESSPESEMADLELEVGDLTITPESNLESSLDLEMVDSELEVSDLAIAPESSLDLERADSELGDLAITPESSLESSLDLEMADSELGDLAIAPESSIESSLDLERADSELDVSDLTIVPESNLDLEIADSELEVGDLMIVPEFSLDLEMADSELGDLTIAPEYSLESSLDLEMADSEPEVITNSLLEEMVISTETSSQDTENSTIQDFSSELFADSEVVEDFNWSDIESEGQVAQDSVETSLSPDWADVAADPTAPDIFATFTIQEPESQTPASGAMDFETEVEEDLTVIQNEPISLDLSLETETTSPQIEENWPELTVQDVDIEPEESFELADLAAEFTAETPDLEPFPHEREEDLTVIQTEPISLDLSLETETSSTQVEESWPELTVQDVDIEPEESFDLADVDLDAEESFDLADLAAEFTAENFVNDVEDDLTVIQTEPISLDLSLETETTSPQIEENWPELTVQDVDIEAEESFDLADLAVEFTAETPETQTPDSPTDLAEIQAIDVEDWESLAEPSGEEVEAIAPPVSSPALAADIPEEDLADLMAELASPPEPEAEMPHQPNWSDDDLADLAAELAAEDPAFQDYIQNQESDELADWSAELATEDPSFQDNGVLGGHTLSPQDLVTTPEPSPAAVEKKINSPRPKQIFKSLLNNAQGRARQTKQQNSQQNSQPEILPNSSQQGSISQTVAPTPPQALVLDISGVWYLGIDFGTTGLSAVLLNQVTGEHFPIYWHTEAQTSEGGASFRLPAIAYTGVVAQMERNVPRPGSVERSESELRVAAILEMIRSAFAPPLTNPQAGERLAQIKPYLNVALPYYSPEQKAWQPIVQGANQRSFALHWLQRAAQALLSTLTGASPADQLPIGAVGLAASTLQAVMQRLQGVIVGISAVGGEAFRFNVREAILGSQLVTQPDQVFFLEDSIATVLAGLTGNALPGVPWRGGTLVMNGGARSIEITLVDLPENLVELHRGNFACRSFEYGGDAIDQDILLQLLAPRLSEGQLSLQTVGAELPAVGVPAPSLRNRWQMVFQQSELGQTLQNEARRLKQALQQQEQVSVTVGDQTWEITRQELEQRVLHPWMEHLNREVNALLVETGMNGAEIRTCVCTGGTTALRVVGKWLRQKLPNAVVIRDRVSLGESPGLSCTPIAYGLASLPLYPTVLDRLQHQYSDYFLFMEVLRAFPDTPLTLAEITQRLELRGIYTRSCQSRLQSLLAGELPRGLVPSESDAHLLESASAENPDYQRIGQTPLFTKVAPRSYQLNRAQAAVIMKYLQTILRGTAQTLNEPLAIPGSLLALSIQS